MSNILEIQPYQVTSSPLDKVWLLYGEPGTRKTSVAVGEKNQTLLLAFEVGYKFIPGVYAANLNSWIALKQYLNQLDDPKVREKFKTIAIDTIGLAYKSCVNYICAQKGVSDIGDIAYGKGYSMAKNEFEKVINSIPQRGYGLIMVAHSDELNDEKNGVSVKVDIDKRPSSVIKGLADFILYSRKEKKDGETDEVTVYAYSETKSEKVEVKSRARFFPKRFEFTYENLLEGLKVAIQKQDEFFGVHSIDKPNFEIYEDHDSVDLESLKQEVTELAVQLFDTAMASTAEATIKELLPDTRISQATKNHIAALFAIKDRLEYIKKGLE